MAAPGRHPASQVTSEKAKVMKCIAKIGPSKFMCRLCGHNAKNEATSVFHWNEDSKQGWEKSALANFPAHANQLHVGWREGRCAGYNLLGENNPGQSISTAFQACVTADQLTNMLCSTPCPFSALRQFQSIRVGLTFQMPLDLLATSRDLFVESLPRLLASEISLFVLCEVLIRLRRELVKPPPSAWIVRWVVFRLDTNHFKATPSFFRNHFFHQPIRQRRGTPAAS